MVLGRDREIQVPWTQSCRNYGQRALPHVVWNRWFRTMGTIQLPELMGNQPHYPHRTTSTTSPQQHRQDTNPTPPDTGKVSRTSSFELLPPPVQIIFETFCEYIYIAFGLSSWILSVLRCEVWGDVRWREVSWGEGLVFSSCLQEFWGVRFPVGIESYY